MIRTHLSILCLFGFLTACQQAESPAVAEQPETQSAAPPPADMSAAKNSRFDIYATVRLTPISAT